MEPFILVLGIGHLAAAVRLELAQRDSQSAPDRSDRELLFLACSDFDNPASFEEVRRRARADGSALLCAWLEDGPCPGRPRTEVARRAAQLIVAQAVRESPKPASKGR